MNDRAQALIERDIGKMVIRIDGLVAQLEELREENEKLKARIAELEGASNGT